MHRAHVLFFSIVTINLTVFRIFEPGYYIGLILGPEKSFVLLRLLVVLVLVGYAFRPEIRNGFTKSIMRSLGMTLLALGVTTIFSPTLFGQLASYIPIGETLIFIESGILACLLSLELPAQKSPFGDKNLRYLASLLVFQPRKLLSAIKA